MDILCSVQSSCACLGYFVEHNTLSNAIPNTSKKFSVLMLNIRMFCVYTRATALLAIHQLMAFALGFCSQSLNGAAIIAVMYMPMLHTDLLFCG